MLHITKVLRVANLGQWAARPLVAAIDTLEWMGRVATQRSTLRLLDERQLKDIGLSRADALREADRPFWDVPARGVVEGTGDAHRASRRVRTHSGNRTGAPMTRTALPSG